MTSRLGLSSAGTGLALVAVAGLVACGGSSSSSKSTTSSAHSAANEARVVTTGKATLLINPGTVQKIKAAGVTVSPTKPGTVAAGAAVLPASGGRMVTKTLVGSVHTGAGLVFAKGAKKVQFSNIAVNTQTRKVTGSYNGHRISLYQMRLSKMVHGANKNGQVSASAITLVLAKTAATVLNKQLGVTVFRHKQPFGTVAFTVVTISKKTAAKRARAAKKHHKAATTSAATTTSTATTSATTTTSGFGTGGGATTTTTGK